MKKLLPVILIIVAGCKSVTENPYTLIPQRIDFMEFEKPSSMYRSVPFYSLNDLLDSAELDRQVEEFAKGGYGGVYLHSRTGLLTEYLGTDWWKVMDAGLKAAQRTGTYAWFYDEDKWPSGFAGGVVPLKSEDFHARCLARIKKSDPLPEGSKLLFSDDNFNYIEYKMRSGNAWYNGTCYVDLLNPATVKEFINSSYVPYAERYAGSYGKDALGIFTDEPQMMSSTGDFANEGIRPFSPVIAERFRNDNGYELYPVLPSLFDTIKGYEKVRIDYYRTLSKQLEESFSKQIGDFCSTNNMLWTGHYNGEESLVTVRNNVGNLMLQLRHMQQPGMDHLGLHIDNALNVSRQVSSVANQYGIARRLSEAYGISGQNMNFEDRAWIASWHTLTGINHLCPHLALYSMKGTRKRDYPPTLSPQQPYWQNNRLLEDYTARLCHLASTGSYAAEFLVVHPLESEYFEQSSFSQSWTERNGRYVGLLGKLQEYHRDYDLGDEQILSEIGSVKGDKIIAGKQSYKGVILPYMLTIRKTTIELLRNFAGAGGIILATEMPQYVDGVKDTELLAELGSIVKLVTDDELEAALSASVQPAVKVTGDNSEMVWTSRRIAGGNEFIQVTNTSRLETIRCRVELTGSQDIVLLDPAFGRAYEIKNESGYELLLHPAQSYILADRGIVDNLTLSGSYSIPSGDEEVLAIVGDWKGKRLDVNSLTLDFARYSTDGGKSFSSPEPIIGIHQRLTEKHYNGPLVLSVDFNVLNVPAAINLVTEQPEMYSAIKVNGSAVTYDGKAFYRDMTFKAAPVTEFVKKGVNNIALYIDYKAAVQDSRDPFARYGSEIESIYLTGEFGIKGIESTLPEEPSQHNVRGFMVPKPIHRYQSFNITDEKDSFSGDLVPQGYPFFNGKFILEKEFSFSNKHDGNRYLLKFPLSEAIVISVNLNGRELPPLAWSPYEIDITEALAEGKNTIKITLTNSLRNLLGPHHNAEGELLSLSPDSFTGKSTWTTRRQGENDWHERRLKGPGNTNIWRDDYCVIPFGLLEDPVIVSRKQL
ncbi:MAG TPA: glycosyl hydrolase [Bacteroidales bacterium]|nr:glycosyl hydrolase [Bacteroidales bacterium]